MTFLLFGPEKRIIGKKHILRQYLRLTSQITVAGTSKPSFLLHYCACIGQSGNLD